MNALKHGLDAQTLILPGEDEAAFQARLDAWRADIQPRNPLEESLVEEAVRLSWQVDRADRVQAALLAERFGLAAEDEAGRPEREASEAERIGEKLLAGPPIVPCPVPNGDEAPAGKTFRALVAPDDPDHPARLLGRLEASAAGCRWLLDRWADLVAILDEDPEAWWGAEERIRAVRLLGQQPIDAVDDPMVSAIYLCSFRLDPAGPRVYNDQAGELTKREFRVFLDRLRGRRVSDRVPPDRESAREELLAMVDGIMDDVEAMEAAHAERASALAATATDHLAFDDTPEGGRIGRLQVRLMNALLRTIGVLRRIQHDRNADPRRGASAAAAPSLEILAPSLVATTDCAGLRNEPNAPAAAASNEPDAAVAEMRNEPNEARDRSPGDRPGPGQRIGNEPNEAGGRPGVGPFDDASKRTQRARDDRSGAIPRWASVRKAPTSPGPSGRGPVARGHPTTGRRRRMRPARAGPSSAVRPPPLRPA